MDELQNEELALSEEEVTFQVDDDQKAEWCVRKIAEAKKEMMDWIDFYVAQTDKVKDRCERRIQFFNMKLMQYFGSVPHRVTKTQESYQLPSGKLVRKLPSLEWKHDDEQLLPWLMENAPEFVKTKMSVDWAGLKKELSMVELSGGDNILRYDIVDDNGEIVPGVSVTEKPEEFRVEVK